MPKREKKNNTQPTLSNFMNKEAVELDPQTVEVKMDKEVVKLLKIRKEIEQKRREEQRVINHILKLQISDEKKEKEVDCEEQYWVMTVEDEEQETSKENFSLLKYMLGDYGKVVTNNQQKQNKMTAEDEEETEWRLRGCLKKEYLTQYEPSFLHSLQEYQYIANQAQPYIE